MLVSRHVNDKRAAPVSDKCDQNRKVQANEGGPAMGTVLFGLVGIRGDVGNGADVELKDELVLKTDYVSARGATVKSLGKWLQSRVLFVALALEVLQLDRPRVVDHGGVVASRWGW